MAERTPANNPVKNIDLVPQAEDSITTRGEEFFGPEKPISPTRRMQVIGSKSADFTRKHNHGLWLHDGDPSFTSATELDDQQRLFVLGVRIIGRDPVSKALVCRIQLPNQKLTLEGKFEFEDEDLYAETNSRQIYIAEDWRIANTEESVYFFVPPDATFLNSLRFSLVKKRQV